MSGKGGNRKGEGKAGLEGEGRMTFLEHLGELRVVVFRVLITLIAGMAACLGFARWIQQLLILPFESAAARLGAEAGQLALLSPTEGFIVHLKIAFFAGIIVGSPVIFYHIWRFVAPGLYARERRAALPVILSATVCFLSGVVFGFYVLSFATEFFLRFSTAEIANQWSLTRYIGFVTRLVFAFGVVFELPLVIFILSRMGLVTPDTLKRYRRHAAIGIVVLAAVLTPPDPISQMLLALPVYLLFEFSILVSRMVYRKRMEPEEEQAGERRPAPRDTSEPVDPGARKKHAEDGDAAGTVAEDGETEADDAVSPESAADEPRGDTAGAEDEEELPRVRRRPPGKDPQAPPAEEDEDRGDRADDDEWGYY